MRKPRKTARIQASQDRRFAVLISRIADERMKRTGSTVPVRRVGTTTTLIRRDGPGEGVAGSPAVVAALRFGDIPADRIVEFGPTGAPIRVSQVDRIEHFIGPVVMRDKFNGTELDRAHKTIWFVAPPGSSAGSGDEDGDEA